MDNCWLLQAGAVACSKKISSKENTYIEWTTEAKSCCSSLALSPAQALTVFCFYCLYANASLAIGFGIRINISIGRTLHYPSPPAVECSPPTVFSFRCWPTFSIWLLALNWQLGKIRMKRNATLWKLLKINFETNLQNATCNCCFL